jgi:hypothetical protein
MISEHSHGNLLIHAWRAYERTEDDGGEALATIIFSAIAVEAFINGIPELASNPTQNDRFTNEEIVLGSLLDELENQRASVKAKIGFMHFFFTKSPLDKGSLPFQDYSLLLDIRNAIMHKKPERIDISSEANTEAITPHHIVKKLALRGLLEMPQGQHVLFWYNAIQDRAVAEWAYTSGCSMMDYVISLFPEGNFKRTLQMSTMFRPPNHRGV